MNSLLVGSPVELSPGLALRWLWEAPSCFLLPAGLLSSDRGTVTFAIIPLAPTSVNQQGILVQRSTGTCLPPVEGPPVEEGWPLVVCVPPT